MRPAMLDERKFPGRNPWPKRWVYLLLLTVAAGGCAGHRGVYVEDYRRGSPGKKIWVRVRGSEALEYVQPLLEAKAAGKKRSIK